MEKLVVEFRPKAEVDLEKFWQDWGERYAPLYRVQDGLVRYTISRFIESHGPGKVEPDWMWGLEEFWYASREAYEKSSKLMRSDQRIRRLLDEFQAQLDWRWVAWMEERVIVNSGYTEMVKDNRGFTKLLVKFRLREGADSDETWKAWVVGHSQHHLHLGIRKYTNSRVREVLEGEPGRTWGMPEIWYDSREACDYDHREIIAACKVDAEYKRIFDDFHARTQGNWGAFVEEKVIIADE